MSKILAIADIHIHDYPQRNPSDKYRLYQDRRVAQNIIAAGKREGAEILVIAGDIVENFLNRPYVQAEVKGFLDTLMREFKVGYIIWGNHDLDNKGNDQDFIDCCLSVMLPPNLYYADKREVTIDNSRIAFSNWRPTFDLSWINGTVDVLFTHATICYSPGTEQFKSQDLDQTKFNLAICGDIHRAASIGKFVSIGIPQRCKMSDSDKQTGVIYDCVTKQYKWVDLNPSNNLMKFQYSTDQDKEGWDSNSGIWTVYKPNNHTISSDGTVDIVVPAWQEVDNLIKYIIDANNLQRIHGEVLKSISDIDSKEVDFNFIITRFYCKNWRSIEEAEIYFNNRDKILITGDNGSGKSSLLSALKYAFIENPHYKDFVQFGSKECVTEVEFVYQGNNYKIQRGSKKYGFWINGVQQKFNSKLDFQKLMHQKFPFIDYMDVYFFDSDHHKLIGGIAPERKSEIVSKVFKMDKIDAFNEQACVLLDSLQKNTYSWKSKIDGLSGELKFINEKLSLLVVPSISEQELRSKREAGKQLQEKWITYNNFLVYTANLQAQKKSLEDNIINLKLEAKSFRPIQTIDNEIQWYKGLISQVMAKSRQLNDIKSQGNRAFKELQSLKGTKICPSCGQEIKNTAEIEQHKVELGNLIDQLKKQQSQVYADFATLGFNRAQVDTELDKIIEGYNREVAVRMTEKQSQQNNLFNLQKEENSLANVIGKINSVGNVPEKVELPEGFLDELRNIETSLSIWREYNSLIQSKITREAEIKKCEAEIMKIQSDSQELQAYIKLTNTTGKIYEEIMNQLAKQFSDNHVRYKVETYNFRKKDHLDLYSYYINNGNEVGYDSCSSGQQTILDVNFLSKIVTRMGLLVMDEFLKHLDPKNHDICVDMISNMNIGCTLLSSHMESIPAFNNRSMKMELNQSGITKLEIK